MNLKEHFETYRGLVKNDMLGGCIDFARILPTLNPAMYPSVYDYLSFVVQKAAEAVEGNDITTYKDCLTNHQKAMLKLLRTYVAKEENGKGVSTLVGARPEGWTWFKFGKEHITFKWHHESYPSFDPYVAIIPLYSDPDRWECPGAAIFDADEYCMLAALKTPELAVRAIRFKVAHFWQKIIKIDPEIVALPIDRINTGGLRDWTQPLFEREAAL
jgi:hypothetical protein